MRKKIEVEVLDLNSAFLECALKCENEEAVIHALKAFREDDFGEVIDFLESCDGIIRLVTDAEKDIFDLDDSPQFIVVE